MDLKLEVKKLEKRETKVDNNTPSTWVCGVNPAILSDLMAGCAGGCAMPC
ncbi:MAG: hypothetical protein SVK08_13690 [Halobacteriota archaeon]|nr:hypothetical protein [Halobacteriota archaeon]